MDESMDLAVRPNDELRQGRFLTFVIENGVYGIPIKLVKEIVGMQPINVVPDSPIYLKGIINLRGNIISILDTGLTLGKESIKIGTRSCIIVIETEETVFGLIVEQVKDVVTLNEIVPPPSYHTGAENRFISGIGKIENNVILLLNCNNIFAGRKPVSA